MKKIIIAVVVIIVLVVAWFLLSPLWRNIELDEALPGASSDVSQKTTIKDSLDTMDAETKQAFDEAVEAMKNQVMEKTEAMPEGPTTLARAQMKPRAHEVAGEALLIEVGGKRYLRFEDLDTVNGPNLHIYLASDLADNDIIDLGPIRATKGNVNYELPTDIDLSRYRNALIWCQTFNVLFSYAEFTDLMLAE